ncbi:MAG TPA: tyrosine-type recombinase/integrase [Novosphingobium sp.]|nr:tyrosine-type recombinase/integrase [Novosphingobium sp.]
MGDLTARFIEKAKPGRHGDGDGLHLMVKSTGAKSWVLRVQVDGRRRDIGLGGVRIEKIGQARSTVGDDVPLEQRSHLTLAEARELSARLRNVAKAGRDPAAERRRDRSPPPSFRQAAISAHADLSSSWTTKTADAFLSSLEEHAFPSLGKKRVDLIEADDIATTLKAIWTTKPSIARKVRQRIGKVLDFAKAKRWRESETPRHSISTLVGKAREGGNFAAMPFSEVPAFFARLGSETETTGRLALLMVIATAARSGEVRQARWGQIDFQKREWNRPAELMRKTGKAHTVTLNDAAIDVLRKAATYTDSANPDALIFANRSGKPISDMTVSKVMRDAKLAYVPHGFRSSFRDWAAEKMPQIPDPVAEAALAHTVPDAVVKAYKRTSFLDMRRKLLDGWGAFITSKGGVVVQLDMLRA